MLVSFGHSQVHGALRGSFRDSATDKLKWDRRRRWQRDVQGYPLGVYGDAAITASVIGGDVAAEDSMFDGAAKSIFIGVSTGVIVWTVTHLLNRFFPGE